MLTVTPSNGLSCAQALVASATMRTAGRERPAKLHFFMLSPPFLPARCAAHCSDP